jgi:hypothetical protein
MTIGYAGNEGIGLILRHILCVCTVIMLGLSKIEVV